MQVKLTIEATGGNTAGLVVPPEVLAELGGGKAPLVQVTLNGHTYQSKVGTMGGRSLVPVTQAVRTAAGVAAGETHLVELILDTAPRVVEPPADLKAALDADAEALAAWEKLAPSHKKAHVTAIEGAKAAETRARRVSKAIETLKGG